MSTCQIYPLSYAESPYMDTWYDLIHGESKYDGVLNEYIDELETS